MHGDNRPEGDSLPARHERSVKAAGLNRSEAQIDCREAARWVKQREVKKQILSSNLPNADCSTDLNSASPLPCARNRKGEKSSESEQPSIERA